MEETGNAAVEFRGACKSFGVRKSKVPVLNHVDMTVAVGTIYGLLGPSGCGKTTSLNCIIGRMKIDSGSLNVLGYPAGSKESGIPGPNVGYMPQELALFGELTVLESMAYFGRLYGMDSETVSERSDELLYQLLDLRACAKRLIKNLSGGQQRRTSFAVSMLHRPCLLILDEPTVGVDPLLRENIWNHLIELSTSGEHTIIITTHYIEEARQAHKVGFMRNGRILDEGEPDKVLEKYSLPSLEKVFIQLCHIDSTEYSQTQVIFQENSDQVVPCKESNSADDEYPADDHVSSLLIKPDCTSDVYSSCDKLRLKMSRIKGLFIKNLIKMWRTLAFLIFQFFIPSIQIIVFCLAIGGDPKDLSIAIVNNDQGELGLGAAYLQQLNSTIIHQVEASSVSDAIDMTRHLKAWGIINIKANFSSALMQRYLDPKHATLAEIDSSSIHVRLDMSDEQIGYTLQREFLTGFMKFLNTTLGPASAAYSSPVQFGKPIFGSEDPTYTEFLAPGVLISIVYFMAVGLTALSFVIERKEGLLDRSYAAGVTSFEVMISHIATQFGVMVIQITLVLVFLMYVFGLTSQGPLVWIILLVILQGMCGMTYGYLISTICDHETSATMLALGSFYPNMLLSGVIWPRQAMPKFLQYISMVMPQTYACESLRCVFSRGLNIKTPCVWEGYLITLAWIIIFLVLSVIVGKLRR